MPERFDDTPPGAHVGGGEASACSPVAESPDDLRIVHPGAPDHNAVLIVSPYMVTVSIPLCVGFLIGRKTANLPGLTFSARSLANLSPVPWSGRRPPIAPVIVSVVRSMIGVGKTESIGSLRNPLKSVFIPASSAVCRVSGFPSL